MTDTVTETQLANASARSPERINDLIVTPPRRSRKLPALALAVTAAVLRPGRRTDPAGGSVGGHPPARPEAPTAPGAPAG